MGGTLLVDSHVSSSRTHELAISMLRHQKKDYNKLCGDETIPVLAYDSARSPRRISAGGSDLNLSV